MFTCFFCKWYFFPKKWTLNGKESRIFIWRHKFMLPYDMYCHMLYNEAPDIFWFTKLDQTINLLKNQCKTLPWNLIKIREYKRECYLSLIVPCGPVFLNFVTAGLSWIFSVAIKMATITNNSMCKVEESQESFSGHL